MKIIHRHLIFGRERFDRCCESALRELARSAKAPRWHLLATSPCVTWARDRRAHAAPGFLLRPAARGPGHLGFAPAPDPESRPRTRCDVPVPLPPPPPHTCPLHPLTLRLGPWNPLSPKSPYASAIFLHESYVAASLPNGLRCPVLLLQPNSCPGPKPFGHCPRRSPPPHGVSHSGRFCSLYAHLLLEKSHKHAGGATVGPARSAGHGTVLWPATPAGPSAPAPSSV